jgi:hypothetical protein
VWRWLWDRGRIFICYLFVPLYCIELSHFIVRVFPEFSRDICLGVFWYLTQTPGEDRHPRTEQSLTTASHLSMTSTLLNRSLGALTIHRLISSSRAMSSASSTYTAATLQRLFPDRAGLSHTSFHVDADAPIVTPPGASSPPAPVQSFLVELVRAAHAAAEASACGSALAGLTSESDEYADVALWIPADHPLAVDVSSSSASGVLDALGLSTWEAKKVCQTIIM